MDGEIATIAENDSVGVLALGVVAYSARRVFRGHGEVWFRDSFGLYF